MVRRMFLISYLSLIPVFAESQTITVGSFASYSEIKSRWPSNSVYVAYDVQVKNVDSFSSVYKRIVVDHPKASPSFLPEDTRDYYMPVRQYHMLYDTGVCSDTGTVWGIEYYFHSLSDGRIENRSRETVGDRFPNSNLDKPTPHTQCWKSFKTQYVSLIHSKSDSGVYCYKDGRLFSVILYDRNKSLGFPVRGSTAPELNEIDLRGIRVMMQRNRNVVPDFDCWWKTNAVVGIRFRTTEQYKKIRSLWKNSCLLTGDTETFYARLDRLFPAGPTEVRTTYFPGGFDGYIYQDKSKKFRLTMTKTPVFTMMNQENLRDIYINCKMMPRLKRIRVTDNENLPVNLADCNQNAYCKMLAETVDGRMRVYKYMNCALLFFTDSGLAYVLYGSFGNLDEVDSAERLESVVYEVMKIAGELPLVCGLHEINSWR